MEMENTIQFLAKKILMVVSWRDFRDEEYFVTRQILEKAGIKAATASMRRGMALGSLGGEVEVDLLLAEANLEDFDGIIFVGGPGAHQHINNPAFHKIAQEALGAGKILAAICIAPAILAKAGVLKGKKATVWSSALDRSAVKILQDNGALYSSEPVVQDSNIITANGPAAAMEFGQKIIEVLRQEHD